MNGFEKPKTGPTDGTENVRGRDEMQEEAGASVAGDFNNLESLDTVLEHMEKQRFTYDSFGDRGH